VGFVYADGGRADTGRRGSGGDCVTRAIAIASGQDYQQVFDGLRLAVERERPRRGGKRSTVSNGVKGPTLRRYMASLGWEWTPTMQIGSGCKVHLRADELPSGRLVVQVSGHVCAVIDGVVHDTHDPSRGGTRCVYGYWQQPSTIPPGSTS
jgi:hypothetical protein